MKPEITIKVAVEFVNCPKCEKGPLNYKQETVDKFIKAHAGHLSPMKDALLGALLGVRIIGKVSRPSYLKQKVAIRVVEDLPPWISCRWKKCKNYSKGTKTFCQRQCKKQYKKYKRRKK